MELSLLGTASVMRLTMAIASLALMLWGIRSPLFAKPERWIVVGAFALAGLAQLLLALLRSGFATPTGALGPEIDGYAQELFFVGLVVAVTAGTTGIYRGTRESRTSTT